MIDETNTFISDASVLSFFIIIFIWVEYCHIAVALLEYGIIHYECVINSSASSVQSAFAFMALACIIWVSSIKTVVVIHYWITCRVHLSERESVQFVLCTAGLMVQWYILANQLIWPMSSCTAAWTTVMWSNLRKGSNSWCWDAKHQRKTV